MSKVERLEYQDRQFYNVAHVFTFYFSKAESFRPLFPPPLCVNGFLRRRMPQWHFSASAAPRWGRDGGVVRQIHGGYRKATIKRNNAALPGIRKHLFT